MIDAQSKNFVSVVLLSFPSKVQYDLWYEKYITFYNSKAVDFLKKNGQLSQSANLVDDDNDLIDRHAFVCYELVALGLVKEETMDMLNNKFDKMDEQGDGFISFDEAMKKGYLFENKDTKKVL